MRVCCIFNGITEKDKATSVFLLITSKKAEAFQSIEPAYASNNGSSVLTMTHISVPEIMLD